MELNQKPRPRRISQDVKMSSTDLKNDTSLKINVADEKRKMSKTESMTPIKKYLEIFIAETIATSLLMGIGCMSCVEGLSSNKVTDFHSAITFGFTVSSMICTFGHISAAHMNPAVTIAFFIMGQITLPMVFVYFIAEIIGATAGVAFLKTITPPDFFAADMCVTKLGNGVGVPEGLAIEFVITFMLVMMICGLNDPRSAERQDSVPIKFSAAIIAISFAAGKYTGASMNPARSLAPAIWTNFWTAHWIYWVGPITAATTAPLIYLNFFQPLEI